MSAKQAALSDMRKCGINVSFFLYDIWFGDARRFNGGYHPKKTNIDTKLASQCKDC